LTWAQQLNSNGPAMPIGAAEEQGHARLPRRCVGGDVKPGDVAEVAGRAHMLVSSFGDDIGQLWPGPIQRLTDPLVGRFLMPWHGRPAGVNQQEGAWRCKNQSQWPAVP